VLYGELVFVPFFDPIYLGGLYLGTVPVFRMGLVLAGLAALILLFYKEILVTTFDAGLARALGISPAIFHYGLMVVLSLVIVNAFEAVGAILVIAMLILPPATALLVSQRLSAILLWVVGLALVYSVLGYHLDIWLNATMAGTMVVVALGLFLLVWVSLLLRRQFHRKAAGRVPSREALGGGR